MRKKDASDDDPIMEQPVLRIGSKAERRRMGLPESTVVAALPEQLVIFGYTAQGPYGTGSITEASDEPSDIQNILEHETLHQAANRLEGRESSAALDVPTIKAISHSKVTPAGLEKLAEYYRSVYGRDMPAYQRARQML